MKKANTILVIIVMFFSTIGVVIEKHYSMGDLYDIAFFSKAEQCCQTGCGCCDEDTHLYRLQEEYSPQVGYDVEKYEIQIATIYNQVTTSFSPVLKAKKIYPSVHAPPGDDNDCSLLQSYRC